MIRLLFRCFLTLAALCSCTTVIHAQLKIMTIGDSITKGFPHSGSGADNSYHTTLSARLPMTPFYVGDSIEMEAADGMPEGQFMVGKDGGIIKKVPTVYNTRPSGAQTRFENARAEIVDGGGVDAPDYVVILLGINDLVELINPNKETDWFIPGVTAGDFSASGGSFPAGNGDYRSAGVFIDGGVDRDAMTYTSSSNLIEVASIKDRYQELLDAIVYDDPVDDTLDAFPNTHVILVSVPIPDTTGSGNDPTYGNANRPLVKETVINYNLQVKELADSDDRFSFIEPWLIRPINTTDSGSPPSHVASPDLLDGVHPTVQGYEKIGEAIASVILFRLWSETEFPSHFDNPATEATIWGAEADPDDDGWPNILEYYLNTDPHSESEPLVTSTVDGDDFTYLYHLNEDAVLRSVDVEYSTDLNTWHAEDFDRQPVGAPSGGLVPVEATLNLPSWERAFFRLVQP